jgi:large subunit ribosomal protein L7/L12
MSVTQEQVVDYIKNLKLSEVKGLIEVLENELGVSASAPVMAVAGPAGAAPAEEVEEKTEFDVVLTEFEAKAKIKIIKEVRKITGAGLKDAKSMVEKLPSTLKEGVSKDAAEEIKKTIEGVGGKVEIK